jgi:hypothetical protein
MLKITWSEVTGFGLHTGMLRLEDVPLVGSFREMALDRNAAAKLREVLGVPVGLTAEQAEVARRNRDAAAELGAGDEMIEPTTKEPFSTLQRMAYREQPDLRCCGTCRHAELSDTTWETMYCQLTVSRTVVSDTAVCDAYEQVTP